MANRLRIALAVLAIGLMTGCSGIRPYPNTLAKNVRIRTDVESAVCLAHMMALRVYGDARKALRSQIPMLVLMVLYTVSSLWILSQPLVKTAGKPA
ncbi:MAG TPA: hypothetical protein VFR64_05900 [Methylomirabilota bacterium]|nr:hypothetical protein [Methylomirabilota bacterium]